MEKVFYSIKETCAATGLSIMRLRKGCRDNEIPHIRIGDGENARMMINFPLFIEQLNRQSRMKEK